MLRKLFVKLKTGTEYLNYGRHILERWGYNHIHNLHRDRGERVFKVLDIGCGHGTDLLNIKNAIELDNSFDFGSSLTLMGIENYQPYVLELKEKNIKTYSLDIERDYYPFDDGSLDLIIANQVLEHTKEIFWITSEAVRCLKTGGKFLVGVPNLASLHNRFLLLLGIQPTQIQSLSAHVRGFTKGDFKRFAEEGGYFRLKEVRGSNFYPLPPSLSKPLSALFPTLSWGIFFELERTDKVGSFLDCLTGGVLETPFFGSPQNPAPSVPSKQDRQQKKKVESVSKKSTSSKKKSSNK